MDTQLTDQLTEIRDQQKAAWNKFSTGWKKWDGLFMDFLKPMGDEIIASIKPSGDQNILDIAAGTGEPGLTIASMLDGGKVTITDLSDDMLVVAKENAAKRGATNVTFNACDVCELPYSENEFDSISCRFGYMFFPDIQLAADEMYRVLKPGGQLATSVWTGPEKNFWVTAIMGPIRKQMELPPPPPDAPGIFRCADPEMMKGVFKKAGFKNIAVKEVPCKLNVGNAETFWTVMTEVAAPVVAGLSNANDEQREKIKAETLAAINQKYPGQVEIDGSAWVISAEK